MKGQDYDSCGQLKSPPRPPDEPTPIQEVNPNPPKDATETATRTPQKVRACHVPVTPCSPTAEVANVCSMTQMARFPRRWNSRISSEVGNVK